MFNEEYKEALKEVFREVVQEELAKIIEPKPMIRELPHLLSREQLMEFFHMKSTKASELLKRADFPKIRDAGHVLIPSKQLLEWIDEHTEWMRENTTYFQSSSRKSKKVV